jgi:predicted nucleic acid-binding protein
MALVYPDEPTPASAEQVVSEQMVATPLLRLELANSLRNGVLRKRYTPQEAEHFADALDGLQIDTTMHLPPSMRTAYSRALFSGLTPFDATYVDLALTLNLKLATLDDAMAAVARRLGISVFA